VTVLIFGCDNTPFYLYILYVYYATLRAVEVRELVDKRLD
jgi:hypothetical protein